MNRRTVMGLALMALTPRLAAAQATLRPILVVGATARMAPEIIVQALDQGRRVTALARSPERIEAPDHPNLKKVKGDVYDLDSLTTAMTGDEVVISLIGPRTEPGVEPGYVDLYSVGTATIISAMRLKGNTRLLITTSGGTEQVPAAKPTNGNRIDEIVWKNRNLYGDMQRAEKIVAVSGLDYIVLRPRFLGGGPKKGNLKFTVHDDHTAFDTRTGGETSRVLYADIAEFVLTLLDGPNPYLGKAVGIYSDEIVQLRPAAAAE
ncbi:MAG: NAD(P)H-binding protein [Rhodospirillaceae bacterium]|nr:NAD(P)H-binding protein [Rhodospirillaceae bacterium]